MKTLPADFRLYVNVTRNRKTKRLMRDMGDRAFYCIVSLWCYTAENCPDGNLGDVDASDIADMSDYDGVAAAWLDYLVVNGWLDTTDAGLHVHDWEEMQPWAARDRTKQIEANRRNALKRWDKVSNNANSHAIAMQSQCDEKMQLQCPHPIPNPTHTHTHPEDIEPEEESPGTSSVPAPSPRIDPLKRVSLDEDSWTFHGITDTDRATWQAKAPAVHIDRELDKMIRFYQSHPGKLAARRKGGRWLVNIENWMVRAQEYSERGSNTQAPAFANKSYGLIAATPRDEDQPSDGMTAEHLRAGLTAPSFSWDAFKAAFIANNSHDDVIIWLGHIQYVGDNEQGHAVFATRDVRTAAKLTGQLKCKIQDALKVASGRDMAFGVRVGAW